MGLRFISVATDAFGITVIFAIVLWCWHWVEHEFAWPGWFVPVEAKDVPGRFFARREARRREKAELLALGQELLHRERETESRTGDADSDPRPDSGDDTSSGPSSGDRRE